ncbi:MAG: DUF4190 domain-containing protein [Actinobacteria bacterium]|jgi:uncharacterized membrane protein|nr:MAG: DUF4190 domain-containing protein [Actinomycetota bacterium]
MEFNETPAGAQTAKRDRLCFTAMVLGIVAVAVPFAELLLTVPAIVLAVAGLGRIRRHPQLRDSRRMAVAGLVLGIIALAMCVPSLLILNAIW